MFAFCICIWSSMMEFTLSIKHHISVQRQARRHIIPRNPKTITIYIQRSPLYPPSAVNITVSLYQCLAPFSLTTIIIVPVPPLVPYVTTHHPSSRFTPSSQGEYLFLFNVDYVKSHFLGSSRVINSFGSTTNVRAFHLNRLRYQCAKSSLLDKFRKSWYLRHWYIVHNSKIVIDIEIESQR